MAFQHGTVEEQEVVKATWKELAKKFWVDTSETNKAKTYHRTKVFEWLCATEHDLHIATGAGWGQFKPLAWIKARRSTPPPCGTTPRLLKTNRFLCV